MEKLPQVMSERLYLKDDLRTLGARASEVLRGQKPDVLSSDFSFLATMQYAFSDTQLSSSVDEVANLYRNYAVDLVDNSGRPMTGRGYDTFKLLTKPMDSLPDLGANNVKLNDQELAVLGSLVTDSVMFARDVLLWAGRITDPKTQHVIGIGVNSKSNPNEQFDLLIKLGITGKSLVFRGLYDNIRSIGHKLGNIYLPLAFAEIMEGVFKENK